MKNKEKANQLVELTHHYETGLVYQHTDRVLYENLIEMAEWKDEQLIRAAKNAFCEMCPHGPCPYPIDNGEECKRRFAFGEKIYNNL